MNKILIVISVVFSILAFMFSLSLFSSEALACSDLCCLDDECLDYTYCSSTESCFTYVCLEDPNCLPVDPCSYALCDDLDPCTIDWCSDGDCYTSLDPNCGDLCTGVNCNDNDACTTDSCSFGICYNPQISCPFGQICSGGTCVSPPCTDGCGPSGATQCSGTTGYQTCGNYDADSCLEWSSVTSCSSGYACSGGVCVLDNPPTGTIYALPIPAEPGDTLSITILGWDDTDVGRLGTNLGDLSGAWVYYSCEGIQTFCSYTWQITAQTGEYYFQGGVWDNVDQSSYIVPNVYPVKVPSFYFEFREISPNAAYYDGNRWKVRNNTWISVCSGSADFDGINWIDVWSGTNNWFSNVCNGQYSCETCILFRGDSSLPSSYFYGDGTYVVVGGNSLDATYREMDANDNLLIKTASIDIVDCLTDWQCVPENNRLGVCDSPPRNTINPTYTCSWPACSYNSECVANSCCVASTAEGSPPSGPDTGTCVSGGTYSANSKYLCNPPWVECGTPTCIAANPPTCDRPIGATAYYCCPGPTWTRNYDCSFDGGGGDGGGGCTSYVNDCDSTDGCNPSRSTAPYNSCNLAVAQSCGTETACSDGYDNDCDGLIDSSDPNPDPDCVVPPGSFNFAVSLDSTSGSVVAGSGKTPTVTVSLVSGTAQTVSLTWAISPSVANGPTVSLTPSSGTPNPTYPSTLTISTTGSTPAGTYTITVTGTGGGLTRTATYTLTVGSVAGCGNKICELGETQENCPIDCKTTITISPYWVNPGDTATVTVSFSDSRFNPLLNDANITLTIDNIYWTNCAINNKKWKNDTLWDGSSRWSGSYLGSPVTIESSNYNGKITTTCTIPPGTAIGVHKLAAVPTIYSEPIELKGSETKIVVMDGFLKLLRFLIQPFKLLF